MNDQDKQIVDERCDFAGHYELSQMPAVRELERNVLGCDYGGTSWTTRSQVDHIVESLELAPGTHLLEIGAGSGWPGLFLGRTTGCDVTLLDIPLNALKQAAKRAGAENMIEQIRLVAASGTALPFGGASFDRISHSDVLCCLPEKLEMLRECRRVATPGACMHFSVILPAPNLSPSAYQEAVDVGPPFTDAPDGYDPLLRESGWNVLERLDVSLEYQQTLQRLVDGMRSNAPALQEAFGADELVSKRRHREDQVALIERGILRREVFVASAS